MINLFVTDLDGTLLNDDKGINDCDCNAIREWVKKGNYFAVATGRPYNCHYILDRYNLNPDFIVGLTGATVYDKTGNLINKVNFENDLLVQICDFLILSKLCDFKIDNDQQGWLGYTSNRLFQNHFGREIENYIEYSSKNVQYIDALKIVARFANEKICNDFIRMLKNKFNDIAVYIADHCLIEIVPINVNKYIGILTALDLLGLTNENVACIGDQGNDAEMVRNAKLGFAMNDSYLASLDIADRTVYSVKEALDYISYYNKANNN